MKPCICAKGRMCGSLVHAFQPASPAVAEMFCPPLCVCAGKDEPGTLEEIFRLMGKPTEENMPGCTKLQL